MVPKVIPHIDLVASRLQWCGHSQLGPVAAVHAVHGERMAAFSALVNHLAAHGAYEEYEVSKPRGHRMLGTSMLHELQVVQSAEGRVCVLFPEASWWHRKYPATRGCRPELRCCHHSMMRCVLFRVVGLNCWLRHDRARRGLCIYGVVFAQHFPEQRWSASHLRRTFPAHRQPICDAARWARR